MIRRLHAWLHRTIRYTVEDLDHRITDLERELPGRCAWCATPTDGREVFWCSDDHRRAWLANRGAA